MARQALPWGDEGGLCEKDEVVSPSTGSLPLAERDESDFIFFFLVHIRGIKGKKNRARGTCKIFQDGRGPGPLARSSTGGPSEFRGGGMPGFPRTSEGRYRIPRPSHGRDENNFLLLSQNPNLEGEVLPRG